MTLDESLRFHPDVTFDLREAIGWYSEISADLANRFRAIVNSSLDDIAKNPVLYPVVFDDVRFLRVHRFPYLVQYRVVNDISYILGVFHSASDPDKWRQRAST